MLVDVHCIVDENRSLRAVNTLGKNIVIPVAVRETGAEVKGNGPASFMKFMPVEQIIIEIVSICLIVVIVVGRIHQVRQHKFRISRSKCLCYSACIIVLKTETWC